MRRVLEDSRSLEPDWWTSRRRTGHIGHGWTRRIQTCTTRSSCSRPPTTEAQRPPLSVMHVGVTRVYFYVVASRDIYVRLLVEDQREGEEHMCVQHMKAMCGTRAVAQHLQRKRSQTVWELGIVTGKVSPCRLCHDKWQVCGLVHGDDLLFVGKGARLKEQGQGGGGGPKTQLFFAFGIP